jgi:hypothetical protein
VKASSAVLPSFVVCGLLLCGDAMIKQHLAWQEDLDLLLALKQLKYFWSLPQSLTPSLYCHAIRMSYQQVFQHDSILELVSYVLDLIKTSHPGAPCSARFA